ncbi:hypothetical protein Hte_000246 [Hypoxylon texense]
MDASQLPDVDDLLVTADNPARTDLVGMDSARCAALHNYLVHYAWVSEGRDPAGLPSNNTFFTTYGAQAEALRPRLHPSVAAFLDTAILLPYDGPDPAPLFFWANGLTDPSELFADEMADLFDQPAGSLVYLYYPNTGQAGESGGGLFYHQGHHRAAYFMHMDDFDYALPVERHPELWHPFETVLSNWIDLIQLGKIAASPREEPALHAREKVGPWEWRPYSEAQVAACIRSWSWLCGAIEVRASGLPLLPIPGADAAAAAARFVPLLASSALDAASVPEPSFARAFLSRARRPRFRCIAPGLALPPADASEFAALQSFTRLPRDPQITPPVCLFPAARGGLEADITGTSSPFYGMFADSPAPSRVPAGVYSEAVDRGNLDSAEEGFRLLLPYGLEGGFSEPWNESTGARKSDGSFITRGSATELFQHGYKPFGGDYYRPQRLERLFDHWRKLIDDGVWSVGPQGVEGNIETFKQADTVHWADYIISPTW